MPERLSSEKERQTTSFLWAWVREIAETSPETPLAALRAGLIKIANLDTEVAGTVGILLEALADHEEIQPPRVLNHQTPHGLLTLDTQTHTATAPPRSGGIPLSPTEAKVFRMLIEDPETAVSSVTILKRVWGINQPTDYEKGYVRIYIGYLREKLGHTHQTPLIHTIRSLGYSLTPRTGATTPTLREVARAGFPTS